MLKKSFNKKVTRLGVTALLCAGSLTAQATIVMPSCNYTGYACEFLEFSYSQNYSRDEIDILRTQEGSVFYGYRYASRYETEALLDSYFALPLTSFDTGWRPETYNTAVDFLTDFGALDMTTSSGATSFIYGSEWEITYETMFDDTTYLGYVAYDDGNAYVPATGYFYETQGTDRSVHSSYLETTSVSSYNMYTASLLVRYVDVAPVPVPAAVWLFGSGLVGLIGIARRKNA